MDLGLNDERFRLTNRNRSKAALQHHTWEVVCDKAFPALLNIAQKVDVPHRVLGDMAPLGTQFETSVRAKITQEAADRFYASAQFDSDSEGENK
jgi:hypothetical protein